VGPAGGLRGWRVHLEAEPLIFWCSSRRLGTTALVVAVALSFGTTVDLTAQTRRALLVGINSYERFGRPGVVTASGRERIKDLEGSVNDVQAVGELLRARFGFESSHITLLLDSAATRDRIIAAIRRLGDAAQPGDIVFFYYAGHGSQRRNSLSARPTKVDQTIVPVDANAGVFDIRDKELARLFGAVLNKGVALTLIFDSCHSGAITRGIAVASRQRWAALDPRDAADPETPPAPEDHGALVISSAQDYETAGETPDAAGVPHGVFSSALVSVLRAATPDEPATRLFQQVKAIMQSQGRAQEPVLAGTTERLRQPLLGGSGTTAGQTTVAVLRPGAPGQVELQGGAAIGLRPNAELAPYGGRPGNGAVRLRIIKVSGLSSATAEVLEGERDSLRAGDLFTIVRWAPPPAAGLRVWMPAPALDGPARARLIGELAQLRDATTIEWIDDPTALPADSTPLGIVRWGTGGWILEVPGKPAVPLSRSLSASPLRNLRGKVRLFVFLPPSQQLAAGLMLGRGTRNDLVDVVDDRASADYLLAGRVEGGRIEYAWVRPNASQDMARSSTLPIRGDWVATGSGTAMARDSMAAGALVDQALRLAKVRSWLEMEGPPSDDRFPYRLALRNAATGELKTEGPVYDGEWYGLVLQADPARLSPALEPRRVYVFGIASNGESVLLFPPSNSNVLNRVPYAPGPDGTWPATVRLGSDSLFDIREPLGMDTYILLTSDEVVPAEALAWQGVRTRAPGASPLASLLFSASSATRAPGPAVPLNWSIQRLSILSAAKP
jgi:hypothetical protein